MYTLRKVRTITGCLEGIVTKKNFTHPPRRLVPVQCCTALPALRSSEVCLCEAPT
jgi:hypothetical protein